jgi:hypothetical protein
MQRSWTKPGDESLSENPVKVEHVSEDGEEKSEEEEEKVVEEVDTEEKRTFRAEYKVFVLFINSLLGNYERLKAKGIIPLSPDSEREELFESLIDSFLTVITNSKLITQWLHSLTCLFYPL